MHGLQRQFGCGHMVGFLASLSHSPHAIAAYTNATVQSKIEPTLSPPTRLLYNAHTFESVKPSVSQHTVWLGQGLGKTLQSLMLILANPAPASWPVVNLDRHNHDKGEAVPIKTTLIVMPANLLQQWQDELSKHVQDGALKWWVMFPCCLAQPSCCTGVVCICSHCCPKYLKSSAAAASLSLILCHCCLTILHPLPLLPHHLAPSATAASPS